MKPVATTDSQSAYTDNAATYEDRFNPVSRRLRRLGRGLRALGVRAAGRTIDVLVEIRWRLGDEVMALPIYDALWAKHAPCRVHVWCNYPDLVVDHPHVASVNDPVVRPHRYYLLRGAKRDVYRLDEYARQAEVPTPTRLPTLSYTDWTSPVLARLPEGKGPLVAVAAGASWPTKRWPLDNWRRMCLELIGHGLRVVELGQGEDPIGVGTSLLNQTTVREAASVLRAAKLLVCSDSGLMHLALAAGTPVLALFGPTEPSILIRGDERFTVIANGRDCQGCWNISQRMVTAGVCPLGVFECMGTITSDVVALRAIQLVGDER